MLSLFKISSNALTNKQANWFASEGANIITFELQAKKQHISELHTYYCEAIKACIYKLRFNPAFIFDEDNKFVYFLLTYANDDFYKGAKFEATLLDEGNKIKWIHENKLCVFKAENSISRALVKLLK